MRTIPIKVRERLSKLKRMRRCCLSGPSVPPIEWHHPWMYAGKQIIDEWATVAVSQHKHRKLDNGNIKLRDEARRESLMLATKEDLAKYPKRDWRREKIRLGCLVE